MSGLKLKQTLLALADKIKPSTTLEEVYEQLALLSDIEKSELEIKEGKIIGNHLLKNSSKKWIK